MTAKDNIPFTLRQLATLSERGIDVSEMLRGCAAILDGSKAPSPVGLIDPPMPEDNYYGHEVSQPKMMKSKYPAVAGEATAALYPDVIEALEPPRCASCFHWSITHYLDGQCAKCDCTAFTSHEHCWHPRRVYDEYPSRWMECCTFECDETRNQTDAERVDAIAEEYKQDEMLRKLETL